MVEVSLVVPCYNVEKFLGFALESALHQSYSNYEIICVDDKSTDNTLGLLKKYESKQDKIRIFENKSNQGYALCLRKAIAMAEGSYIMRFDADDYMPETRIEKMLDLIKKYPDCAFASSHCVKMTPFNRWYTVDSNLNQGIYQVNLDSLGGSHGNKRNWVDPATIFSKEKYERVGGYNSYQRSGMDVDLWIRLIKMYGPAVITNERLYAHRVHKDSITHQSKTLERNNAVRIKNGLAPTYTTFDSPDKIDPIYPRTIRLARQLLIALKIWDIQLLLSCIKELFSLNTGIFRLIRIVFYLVFRVNFMRRVSKW